MRDPPGLILTPRAPLHHRSGLADENGCGRRPAAGLLAAGRVLMAPWSLMTCGPHRLHPSLVDLRSCGRRLGAVLLAREMALGGTGSAGLALEQTYWLQAIF